MSGRAIKTQVLYKATRISLVVGPVLVVVNNLDHFLAGTLPRYFVVKAALSFAVPFCVATYSAMSQLKDEAHRNRQQDGVPF